MKRNTPSLFYKIIGVGSASGLLYQHNTILIISDNSSYLYEYQIQNSLLNRFPLTENAQENIPKIDKLDFEAIAEYADSIYIFGSGSAKNRNTMIQLNAKTKAVVQIKELSNLYLNMQSLANIEPENFNIEGVIFNGHSWFFFHRGNGKYGKNLVFSIKSLTLNEECTINANEYTLPKIKDVSTGFTDAILVEDKIYFLAAAEDSNSTYDDGEVLGSIIGSINLKNLQIEFTKQISDTNKFEGLALYKKSAEAIEFLLCEDKDSADMETAIYLLNLKI